MIFYDYKSHSNRLAYYRYLSSHVAFSRKMGDFGAHITFASPQRLIFAARHNIHHFRQKVCV
jgi:hypothetical protein